MEARADIGGELRAERVRLGLSLQQAESDTRIRVRYLEALEEERFGELPGDAYVRGFLRSYATYLGLDGGRFLAAYRARAQAPEPPIAPRPLSLPARRPRIGLLLAAAVAVIAAVGLGAWKLDDRSDPAPGTPTPPHPESVRTSAGPATAPEQQPAPPPARPAAPAARRTALVLTARGGNSWLDVRIGGPAGPRAWTGTLQPGRTLRLGLSRALFIRAGAPHNLHATIGGEVQPLQAGVFDLVATREGVRPRN